MRVRETHYQEAMRRQEVKKPRIRAQAFSFNSGFFKSNSCFVDSTSNFLGPGMGGVQDRHSH